MTSRVALDGGQSGCRARDAAGRIWEGIGIDTSKPRIPQLAAAVRAAAPDGAERVLLGTTGLGPDDTAAALLEALHDHGTRSVYVAHDSVTSYLGALSDRTGCVIAAGTGLGLRLPGRIAEQHENRGRRGSISLANNGGAVFVLRLPM